MSFEGCERMPLQEQNLYFNKTRILRWMRWIRGEKDLHPELLAYKKQQRENNRWIMLRCRVRKTS